jgi:hypothetical protein
MKMRVALAVAGLALGTLLGSAVAQATTYDLSGDFSTVNTSGSPWSIIYNNSALPIQPAVGNNGNHLEPAIPGPFFGTGSNLNQDNPFAFKAAVNGSNAGLTNDDFLVGDIVIHSPNTASQTINIVWTAPSAGTISELLVSAWYAHSSETRGNDVTLTITGEANPLMSGTVEKYTGTTPPGPPAGADRTPPLEYQEASRIVQAGDLLTLTFQQDSGGFGSLAGAAMHFKFEAAVTPIPAALPLFASALGGLGWIGWRRRKPAA